MTKQSYTQAHAAAMLLKKSATPKETAIWRRTGGSLVDIVSKRKRKAAMMLASALKGCSDTQENKILKLFDDGKHEHDLQLLIEARTELETVQ